jgi:hypothetical protein
MTESSQSPDLEQPTDISVDAAEVQEEQRSGSAGSDRHEETMDTPDELGGTGGTQEGGAG